MDADNGSPRRGLASPVDMLLRGFETTVYAIGFLLLVAAAVLVVTGAVVAVSPIGHIKGDHARRHCPRTPPHPVGPHHRLNSPTQFVASTTTELRPNHSFS
jgi:hypothetical protein